MTENTLRHLVTNSLHLNYRLPNLIEHRLY